MGFQEKEFKSTTELVSLGWVSICTLVVHLCGSLHACGTWWFGFEFVWWIDWQKFSNMEFGFAGGFCELDWFDEVLGLYNEMKLDNLEQNGFNFCYLIWGYCNKRFFNEGRQLYRHVKWQLCRPHKLRRWRHCAGRLKKGLNDNKTLIVSSNGPKISWGAYMSLGVKH